MSRILLNNDQSAQGKDALLEVAIRMKDLRAPPDTHELQGEERRNIDNPEPSSSNDELDFEEYLDKMEHSRATSLKVNEQPVDIKIKAFQQEFLNGLQEVEQFDRSSKLSIDKVIPAYPDVIRDVALGLYLQCRPPKSVLKDCFLH